MTTVILAEKPNQAEAYAKSFSKHKKEQGYFTVEDPMLKEKTLITYGYGHLVSLAEPKEYKEQWGEWRLDVLPILPHSFKTVVAKDKSKQFSIVKKLLKEASTIVIATDCDREGESIAWSIIEKAGARTSEKQYKRLWVNSMEADVIHKGFANLKNGTDYIPFYQEALTRQRADWLVGMNASRLFTLLLQEKNIQGSYSVGRVQTPTLYMIYQRQLANESFQKTPYYEIKTSLTLNGKTVSPTLDPNERFSKKEEAKEFLVSHGIMNDKMTAFVTGIKTETKEKDSPQLHSLGSMQKVMNRSMKATAKQTLDALQKLYDSKLTTYPRTKCRYITESEFAYLLESSSSFQRLLNNQEPLTQNQPRKRFVNEKKVVEHYALIPTKRIATKEEIEKLSPLEKAVYIEIVKTAIAMFLPNNVYEEQTVFFELNELKFKLVNKKTQCDGWKTLFKQEKEVQDAELSFSVGQQVPLVIDTVEKETVPPELFTEGTLISAMIHAGKYVEDDEEKDTLNQTEGIGTEATRADIIETLKQREYVTVIKNKFQVTPKGKIICKAVESVPLLTSPEMTAKWEQYLQKIGTKQGNPEVFLGNIEKFITHLLQTLPKQLGTLDIQTEVSTMNEESSLGTCPKCTTGTVKEYPKVCKCQNGECDFLLFKTIASKKLSSSVIKQLLQNRETKKKVTGFKGKKGTFDAFLKLDANNKIVFAFDK